MSLINQRFHMKTVDFDLFLYGIKVNSLGLRGSGSDAGMENMKAERYYFQMCNHKTTCRRTVLPHGVFVELAHIDDLCRALRSRDLLPICLLCRIQCVVSL